jgi:hypothetical protein
MPLPDALEIIRAEVRNCRIFAVFAPLSPLKLQCRRSYFPPAGSHQLGLAHAHSGPLSTRSSMGHHSW